MSVARRICRPGAASRGSHAHHINTHPALLTSELTVRVLLKEVHRARACSSRAANNALARVRRRAAVAPSTLL
eukprot:8669180-Alexandrium_andersonii.AAC.1